MNCVDLHVHSTASDGTLTPEQVVRYASKKGLKAIALTDHDTLDGLAKAKKAAAEIGLQLIPGIEMSCLYEKTELHILGFFVDETSPVLPEGLRQIRQNRQMRNEAMLKRFQEDGFDITWEDLTAGNPNTVVTRAHFARVLTEKGYAPNRNKAFDRYLQYGGKYCMRKEPVTPEQVMELLRGAGAFISLAHPMLYHMGYQQLDGLLSYLKSLGLSGVEVWHSSHNPYQSRKLRQLAQKLELLPTGGSDFHGANKPDIDIGTGRGGLRISYPILEDIMTAHERLQPFASGLNAGAHSHEEACTPPNSPG